MEYRAVFAENLQLKAELALLSDVLESLDSCVYAKDLNSRYIYVNAKSCELLGASFDEVIGQDDNRFFAPETAAQIVKSGRQVLDSGQTQFVEMTAVTKATGEPRNLVATKAPLRNKHGQLIGLCGVSTDITHQKRVATQLEQTRELLHMVLDNVKANIYVKDPAGRYLYANQGVLDTAHLRLEDIVGKTDTDLFPAELAQAYERVDKQVFASGEPHHVEEVFVDESGVKKFFWSTKLLLRRTGKPDCLIGFSSDITALKRAEQDVARSEARFRALFELNSEAVMLMTRTHFIDCNGATLSLFGLKEKAQFLKLTPSDLSPPFQPCGTPSGQKAAEIIEHVLQEGAHQTEVVLKRCDNGSTIPVEITATSLDLDNTPTVLITLRDLTERKLHAEQIKRLAFYDALTQLPNRRLLYDRLSQAFAQHRRSKKHGCVIFLDLDNFKPLNDKHGHTAGDHLLQEVGQRLVRCLRAQDTIARLGGDEFVALLIELNESWDGAKKEASQVAEKIRQELGRPYVLTLAHEGGALKTFEHHCTASLGVVIFRPTETDVDKVLRRADEAMYKAKDNGRNQIQFDETQNP